MKVIDRFLVVRRAVLIALNPDCDSVVITRMSKDGRLHKNCIWSDKQIGKEAYLKDLQSMFLDHAKSGQYLNNTALVFLKGVQGKWNDLNPNDSVDFIRESSVPRAILEAERHG